MDKHPTGRLEKDEFFGLYGTGDERGVTDHLFDLVDKDKNGSIEMNEWVIAKKILEAGSQDERLRCA
jgi:Ca2+-binding EF-hand superfamily protein